MSNTASLKARITDDMKAAMRAREQSRLNAIRLILAAIQQQEVDTRQNLSEQHVIQVLDKMAKQRRESIQHFQQARRQDLVDKESYELDVIKSYLPPALSDSEINALIEAVIAQTSANGINDIGKVMRALKPQVQGRADMAAISTRVKTLLSK